MKLIQLKVYLIALGYCLSALACFAQPAPHLEENRSQIQDLYFQSGLHTRFNPHPGGSDFARLFPNSVILGRDRTNFRRWHSLQPDQVTMASLQVGFDLSKPDSGIRMPLRQLKIGFSYYGAGGFYDSYIGTTRTRLDTLMAPQTGEELYLDSVKNERIEMDYSSEQIRLDGAYLLRYNPAGRISFFTGLGLTAGFSVRSKAYVSYVASLKTEIRTANGDYVDLGYPAPGQAYAYETIAPKTNFGLSVYVPLGLDVKLARRGELMSRMHLYLESRPGLHVLVVPEVGTYKKAQLAISLGLRIDV